jgi:hypothetical protein
MDLDSDQEAGIFALTDAMGGAHVWGYATITNAHDVQMNLYLKDEESTDRVIAQMVCGWPAELESCQEGAERLRRIADALESGEYNDGACTQCGRGRALFPIGVCLICLNTSR